MSYALALGLDQAVIDRLAVIGPKCWSADMAQCDAGHNPTYPNCAEMTKIYEEHPDEYNDWSDALPWCQQCYEKNYTPLPEGWQGIGIAAASGAIVAFLIGYLVF